MESLVSQVLEQMAYRVCRDYVEFLRNWWDARAEQIRESEEDNYASISALVEFWSDQARQRMEAARGDDEALAAFIAKYEGRSQVSHERLMDQIHRAIRSEVHLHYVRFSNRRMALASAAATARLLAEPEFENTTDQPGRPTVLQLRTICEQVGAIFDQDLDRFWGMSGELAEIDWIAQIAEMEAQLTPWTSKQHWLAQLELALSNTEFAE